MSSSNSHELSCTVPDGLQEILEEFSTEVLIRRPENIYACLAEYCKVKLKEIQLGRNPGGGGNDAGGGNLRPMSAKSEKLRSDKTGQEMPTAEECVKGTLSSVIGQALQLVQKLEQMKTESQRGQRPPPVTFPSTSQGAQQGGLTHQNICDRIHCLVKDMDQLSMQYDTVLGNPGCPYHQGRWIADCPNFMEPGCPQQQQQQWAPTGYVLVPQPQGAVEFEIAPPMPLEMIPGGGGQCPEDWSEDLCPGYVDPNSFYGPPGGNQTPGQTIRPNFPEDNKGVQPGGGTPFPYSAVFSAASAAASAAFPAVAPLSAAISAASVVFPSAAAAGTAAFSAAFPAASRAASNFIPVITQSVADLFGADKEVAIERTLKSLHASVSTFLGENELGGMGEWYSIIQEFLGRQLAIIQKLLTGQIPLMDAPYEVAVLTVSFLMGLIVGYQQLNGDDESPHANVLMEGIISAPPQPTCPLK